MALRFWGKEGVGSTSNMSEILFLPTCNRYKTQYDIDQKDY